MNSDLIERFVEEVECNFVPSEGEEIYHVNLEGLTSDLCEVVIHHEDCRVVQETKSSEDRRSLKIQKNSFLLSPVFGVGKLMIFYSRFYFLLSLEHIKTRIGYECLHCRDMIPEKDRKVLKFHGFLEET